MRMTYILLKGLISAETRRQKSNETSLVDDKRGKNLEKNFISPNFFGLEYEMSLCRIGYKTTPCLGKDHRSDKVKHLLRRSLSRFEPKLWTAALWI